jgi:hypothetical protein
MLRFTSRHTPPPLCPSQEGTAPRPEPRYILALTRGLPWTAADETLIRDAVTLAHAPGRRLMTLVFVGYSAVLLGVGVALGVVLMHWVG